MPHYRNVVLKNDFLSPTTCRWLGSKWLDVFIDALHWNDSLQKCFDDMTNFCLMAICCRKQSPLKLDSVCHHIYSQPVSYLSLNANQQLDFASSHMIKATICCTILANYFMIELAQFQLDHLGNMLGLLKMCAVFQTLEPMSSKYDCV